MKYEGLICDVTGTRKDVDPIKIVVSYDGVRDDEVIFSRDIDLSSDAVTRMTNAVVRTLTPPVKRVKK